MTEDQMPMFDPHQGATGASVDPVPLDRADPRYAALLAERNIDWVTSFTVAVFESPTADFAGGLIEMSGGTDRTIIVGPKYLEGLCLAP